VKVVRLSIAAAAVSALLAIGAIVAVAAPGAITRAANPQRGAARAVYCPDKKSHQSRLNAFLRTSAVAKKSYFASHPSAKQRTAFLKAQHSQLASLQRALAKCS
jgi:hypothetical protein